MLLGQLIHLLVECRLVRHGRIRRLPFVENLNRRPVVHGVLELVFVDVGQSLLKYLVIGPPRNPTLIAVFIVLVNHPRFVYRTVKRIGSIR